MDSEERFVEAIDEGKIVRVPEFVAKREGLVILKKPEISLNNPSTTPSYYAHSPQSEKENKRIFKDYFQKKPDWKEQQVLKELIDNFHWNIRMERRRKGFTRKQLAKAINESDENLKILETGRLPTTDFVLINKIQKALGINLRKDQKDFSLTTKEIMSQAQLQKEKEQQKPEGQIQVDDTDLTGTGIEILEDEI